MGARRFDWVWRLLPATRGDLADMEVRMTSAAQQREASLWADVAVVTAQLTAEFTSLREQIAVAAQDKATALTEDAVQDGDRVERLLGELTAMLPVTAEVPETPAPGEPAEVPAPPTVPDTAPPVPDAAAGGDGPVTDPSVPDTSGPTVPPADGSPVATAEDGSPRRDEIGPIGGVENPVVNPEPGAGLPPTSPTA